MLKVTVLVDNTTMAKAMAAETGLSLLIEDGPTKILFDTGRKSAFLSNAKKLGADLSDLTHVILSHGHYDHCGGIRLLRDYLTTTEGARVPRLIAHPEAFAKRGIHAALWGHHLMLRNLGSTMRKEEVMALYDCEFHRAPYWINDNLVFLGEIPREKELGKAITFGSVHKDGALIKDRIVDDSALVYKTSSGLAIFVGCSHSGVCNIIDYAKRVTGETRVYAIMGGFHLRSASRKTVGRVARYFQEENIKHVHGCHCTGAAAMKLPNQINIETGSMLEM
jgi:7,8-dihydropterin-6-yl-methyl-4-(beta-D-ribofuranosyl)aminobenzene 5'-phosphate synthase